MTEKLQLILDNIHRFNSKTLAYDIFGFDCDIEYDALVMAPSFNPAKILLNTEFQVTELTVNGYCAGYLVERDGLKIAWAKTAAGGCTLMDHLLCCCELSFKKLIFVGAVGALKTNFEIGAICTPTFSIAGTLANTYLKDSIRDYVPFEQVYPDKDYVEEIVSFARGEGFTIKKGSVFCTDSIVMEYTHLDEIKAFDTDLIEMETSTFYAVSKLLDVPAIALLVVSDNSATGVPLVGRNEEQAMAYERGRKVILPEVLYRIVRG